MTSLSLRFSMMAICLAAVICLSIGASLLELEGLSEPIVSRSMIENVRGGCYTDDSYVCPTGSENPCVSIGCYPGVENEWFCGQWGTYQFLESANRVYDAEEVGLDKKSVFDAWCYYYVECASECVHISHPSMPEYVCFSPPPPQTTQPINPFEQGFAYGERCVLVE